MIKPTLTVSLVQYDIAWENPEENYRRIEKLLPPSVKSDLVILPEMFTTGFSINSKPLAETMDGTTVRWMKELSASQQFILCGSIIIKEENHYFNRFIWAFPNGDIQWYDKRHLFSYGNEPRHFSAGLERKTWEYLGWRFLPQVCYDLRFPVWSRNRSDYDVAVFVASWPVQRSWIWEHLLVARAIENQAYVLGVNRVGTDGMNLSYDGRTLAVAPTGKIIAKASDFSSERIDVALNYHEIVQWRTTFPALDDADDFIIK